MTDKEKYTAIPMSHKNVPENMKEIFKKMESFGRKSAATLWDQMREVILEHSPNLSDSESLSVVTTFTADITTFLLYSIMSGLDESAPISEKIELADSLVKYINLAVSHNIERYKDKL